MGVKSGSEQVTAGTEGGILRLTINRPEKRNAMTWEVIATLRRAVAEAREDPGVRVLVLSGAGDEAFCSGADLGSMHRGVPAGESGEQTSEASVLAQHEARGELAGLFEQLWELGKPTIARVQGWAMAGGLGLALACDLVVASRRARFGAPEINVGLWPYMITVPMLRSMPAKKALELMLTGRVVEAEEADRLGFVTRLVDHEDLDGAVDELAGILASKPPGSMRLGRDSFYAVCDMESDKALVHLRAMLTLTSLTEDAVEGMEAFLEKRAPRWQNP